MISTEDWQSEKCPSCLSINWVDMSKDSIYEKIGGYLCWNCDEAISFLNEDEFDVENIGFFVQGYEGPK